MNCALLCLAAEGLRCGRLRPKFLRVRSPLPSAEAPSAAPAYLFENKAPSFLETKGFVFSNEGLRSASASAIAAFVFETEGFAVANQAAYWLRPNSLPCFYAATLDCDPLPLPDRMAEGISPNRSPHGGLQEAVRCILGQVPRSPWAPNRGWLTHPLETFGSCFTLGCTDNWERRGEAGRDRGRDVLPPARTRAYGSSGDGGQHAP